MKAEELRIGNYIGLYRKPEDNGVSYHSISEIWTPKENDPHYVSIEDGFQCCISGIKPIPLTDDIVIKCGFNLEDESGLRTEYSKDCICVIFDAADIALHIDEGDSYICVFYDNPAFQYLHQLQNLYFALTGQELAVNL